MDHLNFLLLEHILLPDENTRLKTIEKIHNLISLINNLDQQFQSILSKLFNAPSEPFVLIDQISLPDSMYLDEVGIISCLVKNIGSEIATNLSIKIVSENCINIINQDSIYIGDVGTGEIKRIEFHISVLNTSNDSSKLTLRIIGLLPFSDNSYSIAKISALQVYSDKLLDIYGQIRHYNGTEMRFANFKSNVYATLMDSIGNYVIKNIKYGNNITIIPIKSVDSDFKMNTISMYDAAITAQAAQGFRQFSPYQYIAADVNMDKNINIFDATHIAQYAMEQTRLYDSHVGEWVFDPEFRTYEPLTESKTGQDFTGILIGDVDGNWSPPSTLQKESIQNLDLNLEVTHLKDNEIMVSVPYTRSDDFNSMELNMEFDSSILEFKDLNKTPLTENSKIIYNQKNGLVTIGMFTLKPLREKGNMISILFKVKERKIDITDLNFSNFVFNNGPKYNFTTSIELNKTLLPKEYTLEQNYPNPFNATTTIKFGLPENSKVSVQIYNLLGEKVIMLVQDKYFNAGYHRVNWSGQHENGYTVSSGIYFCELQFKGQHKLIKMVYVR